MGNWCHYLGYALTRADIAIIFPPKEQFWPLDRYNISFAPLIGKPLFLRVLESISDFVHARRIILLHSGDLDEKTLDHINFCKDLELARAKFIAEGSDFVECLWSLRSEEPLLAFYACDLALMMSSNPLELLNENLMYIEKDTKRILSVRATIKKSSEKMLNTVQVEESSELAVLYPWDFLRLIQQVLNSRITKQYISPEAKVAEDAVIVGPCYIDKGARILEKAVIKGPCYIGQDALVGNHALIRNSIIEANSIVGAHMEVARSWLGRFSETHSGYIGDSIFSEHVHVGAGFITANVRLDRQEIIVKYGSRKLSTKLNKFGTIIGSNTEIGIHSGTMPGVLIGKGARIGPGTLIFENVPDGALIYAKMQVQMRSPEE